jgi:alpha-aminoadipic semialdehyde synthase
MTVKIGIISEHKSGEGRIPLIPAQIQKLQSENPQVSFIVSPSNQRAFKDDEFSSIDIEMSSVLSAANLVVAVKEIKIENIHSNQAYIFFSHTIKGQDYNMPLLQHVLDVGATLIDYELISDHLDRRLVFFGRHAGLAGSVNSLWSYGQRLKAQGIDSPFLKIMQAKEYKDLADIEIAIEEVGPELTAWMADKPPLVIGVTGYGNVSKGAQHILDILPLVEISADDLLENDLSIYQGKILKVVFKEEDMFEPRDASAVFELQDYFSHPEKYQSKFNTYINRLNILINCIFWNTDCPRLISIDEIKAHYLTEPSLSVVGDITCDIDGSIQFNVGATYSSDPSYVYDLESGDKKFGFEGVGPVVMAVDNLPAELPREASEAFGEALLPFIPAMGICDYSKAFEELDLPDEVKKAVIAHRGQLTPKFEYLNTFLKA